MSNRNINIGALTTIESATGKMIKSKDGMSSGELTLKTSEGPMTLSLGEFDDIYRGLVKCWPGIKPLKDQVVLANREATIAKKVEEKAAEEKAKIEARAKVAKEREDKKKLDAETAAAAAKERKVRQDAAVVDAKKKLQEHKGTEGGLLKADEVRKLEKIVKTKGSQVK